MTSTCIVTDSSAQFTFPGFPGKKCLKILQHQFSFTTNGEIAAVVPKVSEFPTFTGANFSPRIFTPTAETIYSTLFDSLPFFDDIFIILLSKEISPLYLVAEKITASLHGHANLHIIDSQNTSLGLGLLVQYAAELISKGMAVDEIEKTLRLNIPHIYSLFCTPNLSYLHSSGVLDIGQSTVGEMMNLYPLFVMEEGKLNPLQKVKNQRTAIDYFIEFVDEFDDIRQVAFLQPTSPTINESKLLHQHLDESFPETTYTEHLINPYMASLFGPRGFGMVVMENI
ncbi:MAG: DegV family protein [Anaerolineaceae bacterium]